THSTAMSAATHFDFKNMITPKASYESERVRTVRAQRELYLHKHFVGVSVLAVACKPVLAADLRELAGPIRQHERAAIIDEARIEGLAGAVNPRAHEPAAAELVVARSVETESALKTGTEL